MICEICEKMIESSEDRAIKMNGIFPDLITHKSCYVRELKGEIEANEE